MANYITSNEEKALESVLAVKGLNDEQKAIIEKLLKKETEAVYRSSYDRDTVVEEIFDYNMYEMNDIEDPVAFEEKVLGYKPFWEDLFEDLSQYDGFPEHDNFTSSVRAMYDKHFELVDGKLYIRGLADM